MRFGALFAKFPRKSSVWVHYFAKFPRKSRALGARCAKFARKSWVSAHDLQNSPGNYGFRPGIMSFGGLHPFCCGFAPKYARTWGDFHTDPGSCNQSKGVLKGVLTIQNSVRKKIWLQKAPKAPFKDRPEDLTPPTQCVFPVLVFQLSKQQNRIPTTYSTVVGTLQTVLGQGSPLRRVLKRLPC